MSTNRRAWVTAVAEIALVSDELPPLAPGHVRLRVEAAGICGSDLHTFRGENPVIQIPIAPGHEFSGRVHGVGVGVDPSLAGRQVAARPSVPCGDCPPCLRGDEHLCNNLLFVGSFGYHGAFAEYVDLPAACVTPVPDGLTPAELIFAEPIACAIHAVSLAGPLAGRSVLVIGCGTIGLLVAAVAKHAGANVFSTDLVRGKVDLAISLGADEADVLPSSPSVFGHDGQRDFDVAFDCVGKDSTLDSALRSLRKGGLAVLVGVPTGMLAVDPRRLLVEERHLVGSFICRNADFDRAVQMLVQGEIDVKGLVSERYPLEDIARAFGDAVSDPSRVKLVVEP
jgi:2-desacetyl-2-hydroxyethyl bacteriochlorophyllide A dehydrogenase